MKLAEALQERADLNRRMEQLRARLCRNATVQEGETPAEDPMELLAEVDACTARLEQLITRINLTNSSAKAGGVTLTELIARRDALTEQISVYRDLLANASQLASRASRSEIRIRSAVDVRTLQKKTDDMSRALRETDNALQQANWTTDLL